MLSILQRERKLAVEYAPLFGATSTLRQFPSSRNNKVAWRWAADNPRKPDPPKDSIALRVGNMIRHDGPFAVSLSHRMDRLTMRTHSGNTIRLQSR
jgi:hypothetical protein